MKILRTVAIVAITAGVGLMASGVYILTPADADALPNPTFYLKAPLTASAQGAFFAGRVLLNDLAPGDVFSGQLTVTNNSSTAQWVQLQNDLSGGGNGHPDIFAEYPPIAGAGGGSQLSDNAATVRYSISISGLLGTAYPIQVSAFSTSDDSLPFKLRVGQTATVDYTMQFPFTAGNAYQNATGHVSVAVVYGQEIDADNGGVQGGTVPV